MESTIATNPNLPERDSPSGRFYFLDNLKTLIILLVVFFHAAYAYSIYWSQDWYVVDKQKSLFFDVFIMSAFAFMMPVMFSAKGDVVENMHLEGKGAGTGGFAGAVWDCLNFESRVWDFDGPDSKAIRGLHLGDRQGNWKKEKED
jgi:hypothetical protein